jgi:hypothetical protein
MKDYHKQHTRLRHPECNYVTIIYHQSYPTGVKRIGTIVLSVIQNNEWRTAIRRVDELVVGEYRGIFLAISGRIRTAIRIEDLSAAMILLDLPIQIYWF